MNFALIDTEDDSHQPSNYSKGPWVVRDSNGRLHATYNISYSSPTSSWGIAYAYSDDDGATWTTEDVFTILKANGWVDSSAIVVDSNEAPHIIYEYRLASETPIHRMKEAYYWGGAWTIFDITSWNANTPQYGYGQVTAAIDGLNFIYIMYKRRTGSSTYEYWYAYGSGFGWIELKIMDAPAVGVFWYLVVDSNDNAHLIYNDSDGIYERYGAAFGFFNKISSETAVGSYGVAIDSNTLIVSYATATKGYFLRKTIGGSWAADEEVITLASADSYFYPIISSTNQVYAIEFTNADNYLHLEMLRYSGGLWESIGTQDYTDENWSDDGVGNVLGHVIPTSGLLGNGRVMIIRQVEWNEINIAFIDATFNDPPVLRVSGVRHVYRPGSYRLEATLGNLTTELVLPQFESKEVPKELPAEERPKPKSSMDFVGHAMAEFWDAIYGGAPPIEFPDKEFYPSQHGAIDLSKVTSIDEIELEKRRRAMKEKMIREATRGLRRGLIPPSEILDKFWSGEL